MKIAISGASGFIGTHLSAFLSKGGHQIIPLGRELFHTTPAGIKKHTLPINPSASCQNKKNLCFFTSDIKES